MNRTPGMNCAQGMNCTDRRQESLAAFLARVRPGDSCTCCGATLQSIDPGRRSAGSKSSPSSLRLAAEVIVCPACGCEISEETGPDAEESRRALSPAA